MLAEQAAAVGWAAPLEAAGHLVHFHRQLDHQVAKEALPRRSKVRILAQAKTIRCIAVRCLANMRNMQNMTNMTDMFNMTNMTNMNPHIRYAKQYVKYAKYHQYDLYDKSVPPLSI